MQYIWQHINTIVSNYSGGLPLSHYLKNYFKLHPKLGSRDRKILSAMVYAWYRCSKGLDKALSFEEKVVACLQLTENNSKHLERFLPAERTSAALNIQQIFPHDIALSGGINKEEWLTSMMQQPRLFIRARKKDVIVRKLNEAGINFEEITATCLSIVNSTAIDKLLPPDSYVVQDASSQQTGNYFDPQAKEHWWDCCSGAGGKSLLLTDLNKQIQLTVSDKRESILHNLLHRFKQYRLPMPEQQLVDMANNTEIQLKLNGRKFDNIICDVPCTGAGTWARTPEQLYYFDPAMLNDMQTLQSCIATNAAKYLKEDGKLFYITCSVFRKENEEAVDRIISGTGLKIEEQKIINGISIKADSMFITVLKKG
jgi:16S rRNA (cytosine967-C5)-methyltransferase